MYLCPDSNTDRHTKQKFVSRTQIQPKSVTIESFYRLTAAFRHICSDFRGLVQFIMGRVSMSQMPSRNYYSCLATVLAVSAGRLRSIMLPAAYIPSLFPARCVALKTKNEVRTNNFYYSCQLDSYLQNIWFNSFNHNETNIEERNEKIPLIIGL